MASQTSQVEDELIRINGRLVRLSDTPGFDDTNLTDTRVLDMIVTWMGVQSDIPFRAHSGREEANELLGTSRRPNLPGSSTCGTLPNFG